MEPLQFSTRQYLRTLLVLGRASNLPTVWSNCLAGWLLGGDGPLSGLFLLCLGATCLYVGGMYLNDAFDASFDRQHRPERPIPSGAISPGEVWGFGVGWLVLGTVLLAFFGSVTFFLTILLLVSILTYDAIHKAIAFSPVLMALCRFFLWLVAASCGDEGVTGLAIWSSFALAAYIIGLSYVAKSESTRGPLRYWPCWLLAAPLLLAWLVNQGNYKRKSMVLSLLLLVWIFRNLRFSFWSAEKNIGRTVSGLLAGIVLVDLLALAGGPPLITAIFLLLFGSALLFQRFIPAT
jgi:4-hydroxybenzoate polyprenyltransferase